MKKSLLVGVVSGLCFFITSVSYATPIFLRDPSRVRCEVESHTYSDYSDNYSCQVWYGNELVYPGKTIDRFDMPQAKNHKILCENLVARAGNSGSSLVLENSLGWGDSRFLRPVREVRVSSPRTPLNELPSSSCAPAHPVASINPSAPPADPINELLAEVTRLNQRVAALEMHQSYPVSNVYPTAPGGPAPG